MNDSFRASMLFTFDDLARQEHGRAEASFVSFFRAGAEEDKRDKAVEEEAPEASLEDLARKAFEDAYAEGEKAGRDMGMRRVEVIAKRLERNIEELSSFRIALEGKYEEFAVDLALKAAEAIILRECAEHREILAAMIRKAMEMCEENSELVIRVRAEDSRYIETIRSDRIRVIADDGLKEPGFTIETRVGDIDGKISSQLEELRRALTGDGD